MTATHQTLTNGEMLPFNLTDVDRATLAQTDEEFEPHSWEELKTIVRKQFEFPNPNSGLGKAAALVWKYTSIADTLHHLQRRTTLLHSQDILLSYAAI